jgi:hypothetical protein
MSTFLSTIIGMCGCNKARHGPHVASSRVILQRPVRGRIQEAPQVVVDPLPQAVAPVIPVAPVNRFPPRQVNPRIRVIPQRQLRVHTPQSVYNAETTVWGPILWKVLHTLAEFCVDTTLWNDLISRLTIDIPCVVCRSHFAAYIQDHPLGPTDTVNLINWFFTLHNDVNQRTGKLVITSIPSFDTVRQELSTLIPSLSVSFPPETINILLRMTTP